MPYIAEDRRAKLDPHVSEVISTLRELGWNEGDLNYTISRLVGAAFEEESRYHTIARVTGVLKNVADEFYRRIAGPYEDQAIKKNGDVSEYARIIAKLGDADRERLAALLAKRTIEMQYEVEYHVIPVGALVCGGPSQSQIITAKSADEAIQKLIELVPEARPSGASLV